jgi:hypothetical protein
MEPPVIETALLFCVAIVPNPNNVLALEAEVADSEVPPALTKIGKLPLAVMIGSLSNPATIESNSARMADELP